MNFTSEGGSKVIKFSTNVNWTLKVSATQGLVNWCTVSQSSGTPETYNVTVTVAENATYDNRNVVLIFTSGEIVKNVIVNQKQLNTVTLTADRFEVGPEGGSIDVEIKSNVDYTAEIPEQHKNWISPVTRIRALSAKTLTFNIEESKEYDKSEGEIIFTSC